MQIYKTNKSLNKETTLLVTSALPYANGDIHLGHLVEVVQTDIYTRYKKMTGRKTIYICADDTHGTPIQISAIKQGITCEELIEKVWENHIKDYAGFSIDFDIFYTTNSPENRHWAEYIFEKLKEKDFILEKEIKQYFCEKCHRFLPDRFISGTCPKCGAENQYGDVCESCGATYNPIDLNDPRCVTCNNIPVIKKSIHLFVQLSKSEQFLREYLSGSNVLQENMYNFVMHWIESGLKEWCISRDGPYFGFKIPGTENKYFYVWLDAPIGYISSTEKWCKDNNENVDNIWKEDAPVELIHFIGKDIVYFHTLFWPVMLHAASLKLPSKIFVHGFLTVEGEKMSKSRGTFILAREYIDKVKHFSASEYLRFYYGAKLSNNSTDIDLNVDEFCNKVNTTLVNTIGNLHHRTFVFLDRYFNSCVPNIAWDTKLEQAVEKTASEIASHFEKVDFKTVIEKVHALGNLGNKYYQDSAPWLSIKNNRDDAAKVMVSCVNLVKACAVFLKPFIPNLIAKIETQFGMQFQWNDYRFSLHGNKMGKTEKIVLPIEKSNFKELFRESINNTTGEVEMSGNEEYIDISDFQKSKLCIGTIKQAHKIEKSKKLIKLSVDTGEGERQIVAGIGIAYTPEELVGRQIVFVANLKPVKIMGEQSEGMLLAAQSGEKMALLSPDSYISPGASVL